VASDPTSTAPTIYRVTSASTLASASTPTVGKQQLPTRYNPEILHPPSLHNTVSSSSRQITPQRSNYSSTPLLPRNGSGDAGTGEDEDAGDYHPSEEQGGQSDGHISQGPSRRSTGASDTSPTLIDPPQFDLDELRKTNSRPHGTGWSSTNLQNILGENTSKRDIRGMGSRKLATYETFVPVLRLP